MSFYSVTSVFGYFLLHIVSLDKYISLVYCCTVMIILSYIVRIIFEFKVYCVYCFAILNQYLLSFYKP